MTEMFPFVVMATEHTNDTLNAHLVIDRTTVLARNQRLAEQKFAIDNAQKLKGKEVSIHCKPF